MLMGKLSIFFQREGWDGPSPFHHGWHREITLAEEIVIGDLPSFRSHGKYDELENRAIPPP